MVLKTVPQSQIDHIVIVELAQAGIFGAGIEIVTCDEVPASSADVLGVPCRFVADSKLS